MEFLPGAKDFERVAKTRLRSRPRKIILHDRLERGGAAGADICIAGLYDLVIIRDVSGRFLARAPFGERIGGDRGAAVLFDYCNRGHSGSFYSCSITTLPATAG